MPIVNKTNYNDINAVMKEHIRRKEVALIRTLKWVGENVISVARGTQSYKDQTGNLRSSIGAIIVVNGHVEWQTSFNSVRQGQQGAQDGKDFARELIGEFPRGIALICVAGKNYAVHVANRGLDVLDSAELEAEKLMKEMLVTLNIR